MILTLTQKFKKVTGYDIDKFFRDYLTFVSTYYQNIVNYYNGSNIDRASFEFLDYLKNETYKIEPLIDLHGNNFQTTDFWDLNNNFSEIQTKLSTCDNMGKWQRSSRTTRYSSNLKLSHIQEQNETLEKISIDAGFSDQDYWAQLALDNLVEEEDYTNVGGRLLTVSFPNNNNFNIDNIIDYLTHNNIYGKDIVKKLEILSDGDLSTLSGKESLQQTFETIMGTLSGSIPEFMSDGIPPSLFGSNENIIQYPTMFRSLLAMIQKDKRFTNLRLLDISKKEDNIFLEFEVKTITGDSYTNNIIL